MATVDDLRQHFGVARSTLYTKTYAWLWERVVYIGEAPRWEWSDVTLFKAIRTQRGRRRRVA